MTYPLPLAYMTVAVLASPKKSVRNANSAKMKVHQSKLITVLLFWRRNDAPSVLYERTGVAGETCVACGDLDVADLLPRPRTVCLLSLCGTLDLALGGQ